MAHPVPPGSAPFCQHRCLFPHRPTIAILPIGKARDFAQHLADHCVNLKGATFLASSIAGCSTRTSCKKRIQVLRMPVSPSGRRRRWGPATSARVRNTASASTNRMLPNQVDDRILAAVGGHGVLPKYYLQLRRACGKKRSSTLRSAGCGFRGLPCSRRLRRCAIVEQRWLLAGEIAALPISLSKASVFPAHIWVYTQDGHAAPTWRAR